MKNSIILACLAILLSSCYSAHIVAPYNQDVALVDKLTPLPMKEQKRNWYALWGLVPISRAETDEMIRNNGFKRVRVETKINVVDYLLFLVLSPFSVVTSTTVVEGDREK